MHTLLANVKRANGSETAGQQQRFSIGTGLSKWTAASRARAAHAGGSNMSTSLALALIRPEERHETTHSTVLKWLKEVCHAQRRGGAAMSPDAFRRRERPSLQGPSPPNGRCRRPYWTTWSACAPSCPWSRTSCCSGKARVRLLNRPTSVRAHSPDHPAETLSPCRCTVLVPDSLRRGGPLQESRAGVARSHPRAGRIQKSRAAGKSSPDTC